MRLNRWIPVLAGLLAVAQIEGVAHAQTDEEKAAARSLAKQGAEAFTAGKHAEAIDLMSRAEAILHAPPHILYIARAQAAMGKLVASRESYLKVIREELPATAPKAFKDAQQQAKDEIAAVEPRIASLRIVVENTTGAKVTVKFDGQVVSPALVGVHRPVDPGKHVVIAYPMGLSPVEQNIELADAEKKDVKLTISGTPSVVSGMPLDPSDNPDAGQGGGEQTTPDTKSGGGLNTLTIVGIAGLGAGLAGAVVGTIFAVKYGSTSGDADAKFTEYGCDQKPIAATCTGARQKEIDQLDKNAASAGTIGVIGLVAGGVLLAGGATALVLGIGKSKADKPKGAFITPWIAPNGAGVRGSF